MNDFEFFRSLPFGPYLPVDSPLHRLDPRARILLALIFLTALTAARGPIGLALGLLLSLLGYLAARAPFSPLLRGWVGALPFLLILALIQVLFRSVPGEERLFFFLRASITAGDLLAGLALLLRFSGFMAVLGLAAASLSESELTHGLEALFRPLTRIRIPAHDLVMVLQVTLRFFPMLAQTAERIAKAQASRGADWRPAGWNLIQRARQVAPMIVPLFITSLRRAETMALAMDARGYGSVAGRTSMITLRWRSFDSLALLASLAAAVLIVIL